ncbi:UNVERIFIED_CONTAM: hypothetical protein Sradi_5875600 [Sesamum radiatum]|uniref:Uncharacterized protein n=1 Tax=Sesamum radiatum TaxID=300843 RepID=A0AAW2KRV5_SESRA
MEVLEKCCNSPKRIDSAHLTKEEVKEEMRAFQIQQILPRNAVRRSHSIEFHGRIPARRNGMAKFLHRYMSKNYV